MVDQPSNPARRRLGLGFFAAGLARVASAAAAPVEHTLIGTYGGAGCTGLPEVKAFETWLGRRLDVVLDFLQTDTWSGMVNEANWIAGCWKDLPGRRLALSVPMLVHEGDPTLAQGAAGAFDQHFGELARILVASGYANAFIRIGWEFNGNWYNWTAR